MRATLPGSQSLPRSTGLLEHRRLAVDARQPDARDVLPVAQEGAARRRRGRADRPLGQQHLDEAERHQQALSVEELEVDRREARIAVEPGEARLEPQRAVIRQRREQPDLGDPVRIGDHVARDLGRPAPELVVRDRVRRRVEQPLVQQRARHAPAAPRRARPRRRAGPCAARGGTGRPGRERACPRRRDRRPARSRARRGAPGRKARARRRRGARGRSRPARSARAAGSPASRQASSVAACTSPLPETSVRSRTGPPGKGNQRSTCTSRSATTARPVRRATARARRSTIDIIGSAGIVKVGR